MNRYDLEIYIKQ